jgi:hypothetical protein
MSLLVDGAWLAAEAEPTMTAVMAATTKTGQIFITLPRAARREQ